MSIKILTGSTHSCYPKKEEKMEKRFFYYKSRRSLPKSYKKSPGIRFLLSSRFSCDHMQFSNCSSGFSVYWGGYSTVRQRLPPGAFLFTKAISIKL